MWALPRRSVLKLAGGTGAVAAVGGSVVLLSPEPVVAAEGLSARDVDVASDDGSLTRLSIAPEIRVWWEGQPDAVAAINSTWFVETEAVTRTPVGQTPYAIPVESPATSGTIEYAFPEIPLLETHGGPLDADAFATPIEGLTSSRDVTVAMDVVLETTDGAELTTEENVLGPKTFTVSVTHETTAPTNNGGGGGGGGSEVTGPSDGDSAVDTSGTANVNAS